METRAKIQICSGIGPLIIQIVAKSLLNAQLGHHILYFLFNGLDDWSIFTKEVYHRQSLKFCELSSFWSVHLRQHFSSESRPPKVKVFKN